MTIIVPISNRQSYCHTNYAAIGWLKINLKDGFQLVNIAIV